MPYAPSSIASRSIERIAASRRVGVDARPSRSRRAGARSCRRGTRRSGSCRRRTGRDSSRPSPSRSRCPGGRRGRRSSRRSSREAVAVPERRIRQPVDADDLGRDALADLRLVARLGEDHQARVAVQVDEPGRDDLALRVDAAAPRRPIASSIAAARAGRRGARWRRRLLARDADRRREAGRAGPVDDRPAGIRSS